MADKKYNNDGPSAADKALERFTELMIEKIQTLQGDWKKPWFTPGATQPPQNLSGRHYNGGNSLMLMLQAEKMGYDIPVWGTFDRITNLNYIKDKNGNVFQARDKHGNKLPMVTVNKGEKSFPVFLTTFTVVNPETKERIPYDDYRNLSKEDQAKYKVYPKLQVFNVFNVAAQTNLELTRPEMYEKLKAQAAGQVQQQGDLKSHPAIDLMIDENLFFCPINQVKGDKAYYSPANDHIVVPKRATRPTTPLPMTTSSSRSESSLSTVRHSPRILSMSVPTPPVRTAVWLVIWAGIPSALRSMHGRN